MFPLEVICVWAVREKMTSNTGHHIWYHGHHQLAWDEFDTAKALTMAQFDLVDWQMVHNTLLAVLHMFQVGVRACKQVWRIIPTNYKLLCRTMRSPLCPSCMWVMETYAHVLHYNHAGWVDVFQATAKLLDQWMKLCATVPNLRECIYKYAKGQGRVTMADICLNNRYNGQYSQKARTQDALDGRISWRGWYAMRSE
jgi:hypothetical protein